MPMTKTYPFASNIRALLVISDRYTMKLLSNNDMLVVHPKSDCIVGPILELKYHYVSI